MKIRGIVAVSVFVVARKEMGLVVWSRAFVGVVVLVYGHFAYWAWVDVIVENAVTLTGIGSGGHVVVVINLVNVSG